MPHSSAPGNRPCVLLVPPPALPVPNVQGGAVETLLTRLIDENERCGELELVCASVPDPAARSMAAGWQHTRMLYVPVPRGRRRWLPLNAAQRLWGVSVPPWQPWYQAVLLALLRSGIRPDLLLAEGGDLMQCSALARYVGRSRSMAHLHGETACTPALDTIYGGAVAISDYVRTRYLAGSTLPPQNVQVLRNCIDTEHFTPGPRDAALCAKFGFSEQDFVLLFCGRLHLEKGIAELLQALALLPDPHIKLLIIGSPFFAKTADSPFVQELQRQAAALGDRVRFTGYIPNAELPAYYRLADLACVPTLVAEAAGLVPVEAMACGLPVLATRSGGMPEYIADAEPYLVDLGSDLPQRLAADIAALRADPERLRRMSAAGVQCAQRYSPRRYYREFTDLIHRVLPKGANP